MSVPDLDPNSLTLQWYFWSNFLKKFMLKKISRRQSMKNSPSCIWAVTWDFQLCGRCNHQRLRPACAYAQTDQSLCESLEYSTSVKLLTEHHFELLSLKGGCTGSSESTLVKIPHCWKSHAAAYLFYISGAMLVFTQEPQTAARGSVATPTISDQRRSWSRDWFLCYFCDFLSLK